MTRYANRMRSIFLALKAASHHVAEAADAMAKRRSGHPGAQALALVALGNRGGRTLSELAVATGTGQAAATTLVRRMEAQGLVDRRPDENDARYHRVRLTVPGRDARDEVYAMIAGLNAALEEGFSAVEIAVVDRFLAHAASLSATIDDPARNRSLSETASAQASPRFRIIASGDGILPRKAV